MAEHTRFPVSLGRDFWYPIISFRSNNCVLTQSPIPNPYLGADPMLDAVHNLVQEFKARPPPTDLVTTIPYQIKFKSPPQIKPHRLPSYSIEAEQFMKLEIDNLLAAGKIERTEPTDLYCIPFVVPKKQPHSTDSLSIFVQ